MIPRAVWNVDSVGDASHGYGIGVNAFVKAANRQNHIFGKKVERRRTRVDVGIPLVDE